MSTGNNDVWYAFGGSVTGASHVQKQLPNQDAIRWTTGNASDLPVVLAIADGHGSEKYFRSDVGARLAVELAVEELERFAAGLPSARTKTDLFKHLVGQLPKDIVQKWRERVIAHLSTTPFFTAEEWQRYGNGTKLPEIARDPLIAYGATLLTVLVTKDFILYLQLGDGDIVLVSENAQVSKPMQEDARLLANETTSLCTPTAAQDFRIHYEDLNGQSPVLVLLSTDGYSNSFTSEQGFLRVGSDILAQLREQGSDTVKSNVNNWLTTATHRGSGDDITLGILYHEKVVSTDVAVPIFPSEDEEKPAVEDTQEGLTPSRVLSRQDLEVSSPTTSDQDQKAIPAAEPEQDQEAISIAEPEQEKVAVSSTMLEEPEASSVVHVLTVSQQAGEGKYSTIGAALADARPLTRIEVQPGIYREKVLINKDVELIGMGEAGSVTLVSSAPCLTLQASHAQIQNVKIQAQPVSLLESLPWWSLIQRSYAAVEITAGSSLLNNCEILAGKIGVRVHGATASPVIQSCEIHDHTDTGIIFAEGASGLLIDSHIHDNKRLNIEVVDGSHPLILRSQISRSRGKGIYVHKGGRGRATGCDITENRSTGVEIAQQSSLALLNCSISRNRGSGIIFTNQGSGNLIESDIVENELHGIEIKGLCFPHIEHCRLRQGKGSGIVIDSQGKGGGGFIGNCELDGHASASILVQNASNPYIRACNIHDGQSTGLEVRQGASATIDTSTIASNNACCAEASGKGTSLIMNNVELWQQGETQALRFVDGSYGQMDSCRITASSSTAVEINNHALVYLRLCIIKSASFALQLRQGSKAKVEGGSFKKKDAATSCDETSDVLYVDEMQAQSTLP